MKLSQNVLIGLSLVILSGLGIVFFPYAGVGLMMCFGTASAVGVYLLLTKKGSAFSIWKMFGKGTLAFAVMVLTIAFGLTRSRDNTNRELSEYGEFSIATVLDKDATTITRRGQSTTTYDVTFKFKPLNQTERVFTQDIVAPEYRVAYKGMKVKVHYSSRKPEINRLIFID